MKSLPQTVEAPATETASAVAADRAPADKSAGAAQPLAPARWDWQSVRRVLVVRLRSIGDTVLATPTLFALRRFLPHARIDLLLEDWVAPLLEGSGDVDRIIRVERGSTRSRLSVARELRGERYDVAYNLHGGSTATLLVRASGARHRVGYRDYRYSFLYTETAPPAAALWHREKTHSVEQQLALAGWTGVPVSDRPATRLEVTPQAAESISARLQAARIREGEAFALVHPAAAFDSKRWETERFARVVEMLAARGFKCVSIAAAGEAGIVETLRREARAPVVSFTDLTLPEVVALAARARIFVGNDSGIAHIAAATATPSVVVFGSSNVAHWGPWTKAPAEVVREEMACAPCAGYTCAEFAAPECIRRVTVERVVAAVERVLEMDGRS